jgi:4-amino-4-deoxy-L-arabinose transferase-like glycosyltransferase
MPEWLRQQLLIVSVAITVLFFRLGDARLWDRDEPRNARCAVEMLERHDWVVPYFNHELRTHKPVLLYWLIMSAYAMFGETEFAARFWSAALSVGTILCTYHLGRKLFHRQAGFWAALLLTAALMFNVASRAATPDSLLIFLTTATLLAFAQFAFADAGTAKRLPAFPQIWWQAGIIYALMGLAVLAKGPVGIVVPGAIMFFTLWINRCFQETTTWTRLQASVSVLREMRPFLALGMLLLVAGPWYVWVGLRTEGEFLIGFFWDHNVRRATEAMEGHRGSPFFYYPLVLCVGFFPASVFFLPTGLNVWKHLRQANNHFPSLVFGLVWLSVIVGVFSLASTKLPSYVTPCYPALALLVGFTVAAWLEHDSRADLLIARQWFRVSLATLLLVGIAVVPGLLWVAQQHLPGAEWLASLGSVLIVGGTAALVLEWYARQPRLAVGVLTVSALAFTAGLFGLGTVAADAHQQSHLLFNTLRAHSEKPQVASWKCLESSWVYYLQGPILELPRANPQLAEEKQLVEFLNRGEDYFVVMKAADWPKLRESLPENVGVLQEISWFLKDDRLILLGRATNSRVARGGTSASTTSQK